jgi:hypothetical protein
MFKDMRCLCQKIPRRQSPSSWGQLYISPIPIAPAFKTFNYQFISCSITTAGCYYLLPKAGFSFFFFFFFFFETRSHCVAQASLELVIPLHQLPSPGTGMCHHTWLKGKFFQHNNQRSHSLLFSY